jgi:hypothetical protein
MQKRQFASTSLIFILFLLIGCGPLCKKVLRKAISWQLPGEQIFCGSMHSTIDAQLPQKVPKPKTCQTPRK